MVMAPYSLGKLIDWKHRGGYTCQYHPYLVTPYSLGKLIDWKLFDLYLYLCIYLDRLPTR